MIKSAYRVRKCSPYQIHSSGQDICICNHFCSLRHLQILDTFYATYANNIVPMLLFFFYLYPYSIVIIIITVCIIVLRYYFIQYIACTVLCFIIININFEFGRFIIFKWNKYCFYFWRNFYSTTFFLPINRLDNIIRLYQRYVPIFEGRRPYMMYANMMHIWAYIYERV